MAFTSFQRVTASALNLASLRVIARGRRTSNSTGTTTEVGVLRIDDIAIASGRLYRVYTNEIGVDSTVATDVIRLNLRYTTDGSTPSTSSTLLTLSQGYQANAAQGEYTSVGAVYVPGSAETLSVLLTVSRAAGTGTVIATAGTGAPGPCDLYIEDLGVDPGDVGVDI